MDFMGLITKKDWLQKRNLFLSPSKEKGKEDATSQANFPVAENFKTRQDVTIKKLYYFNVQKFNLSTEEYKAGHPLHNTRFIDFTDLFGGVKLISDNQFDFPLKC